MFPELSMVVIWATFSDRFAGFTLVASPNTLMVSACSFAGLVAVKAMFWLGTLSVAAIIVLLLKSAGSDSNNESVKVLAVS